MNLPTSVVAVLLSVALCGSAGLAAQSPANASPAPPGAADADSVYPEQGFLSSSHYLNQYFNFSFELPSDVNLRPVSEPAARDGNVPILDLAGPAPADARILISAIPTAGGKNQDAKTWLRGLLDQELYRGVEELRGLSKVSLSGHQFYLFETRRGVEQHALLAGVLRDYIVQVIVASHDEKVVRRLESSVEHMQFFAPGQFRQYLQADCKAYDGPSISSHRLALLEADPPAKHIDPGTISGDFYENAALGFSYRIPQGWTLESHGAVQPAVERFRSREDFGRPRTGRMERRLVAACSRILFSAWAKRPAADGQISYDDFGEVTVSALSASCFPVMKFPHDVNDQQAFRDFMAQFELTYPIIADMRDAKVFTQDGVTILFLHGTVAFQIPDDELSRRLSLGMAITERRGYLLTWFFAAPHDEELRALTNERAIFDRPAAVEQASATTPGGNSAAATTPAAAASTVSDAGQPAAAANAAPETAGAAASSPDQQSTTSTATATRPSLLRPGESMDTQQGKGPPIRKQKLSH